MTDEPWYEKRTTIHAHAEQGGLHRWPAHKGHLQSPHFHNFTVDAEIEVGHDDRELEFIEVSELLRVALRASAIGLDEHLLQFDSKSCETLAWEIGEKVANEYGKRWMKITVKEDGRLGSSVTMMLPTPVATLEANDE